MRRSVTALAALVAFVGCGSSDSPERLEGRLLGEPFTPVEVVFVGPADAGCSFPTEPPLVYANSAILIGFSGATGLCARASDPCTGQRNLTFVAGTVAHAQLLGEVAPGLQPGTYTVYDDFTGATPDENMQVRAAVLEAAHSDAACVAASAGPGTGEIRLDAVGPDEVRGRVDVTFPDGGYLRGPFVATPCATTFDVCTGSPRACEGTPTCP